MSSIPVMAIVGRPNVGKSLLFNQLIEQKKAVVDDVPGLTRDRNYGTSEWRGYTFRVIDTGGYELREKDPVKTHIREQVEIAIEQADVVLFVVDGRLPLTELDYQIADRLRRSGKTVIVVVNKCDNEKHDEEAVDYFDLGLSPLFPVSALHRRGLTEVLDEVVDEYHLEKVSEADEKYIKVAVCGRQNVGKSTFVNYVVGENRVIASERPGTTRDSIDTPVRIEGEDYMLIDTAGIRRQARIKDRLEKLAVVSALFSIHKADVIIVMLDATREIVSQDLRIAGMVEKAGKSLVLAVNKWDLVEDKEVRARELRKQIQEELYFWESAPVILLSALKGKNCYKLFRKVKEVYSHFIRQIPTPELNNTLHKIIERRPPTSFRGHIFKFYYATQVRVAPPAFELFVNNREWVHPSYQRYLKKSLRKYFGFEGVPIRLYFRGKRGK